MPKVFSKRLEKAIKRADKANAIAQKLREDAVSIFHDGQSAEELCRMLSAIANSEHAFSVDVAKQMQNKINARAELNYDDINKIMKVIENNYYVLINPSVRRIEKEG